MRGLEDEVLGKGTGVWVRGMGLMGIPFVFTTNHAVDVSSCMMDYARELRVAIPAFSILN